MKDFVELLKKRQSFVEMERKQISPFTFSLYFSNVYIFKTEANSDLH